MQGNERVGVGPLMFRNFSTCVNAELGSGDLNVSLWRVSKLLGKDTGAKCWLFSVRKLTFAVVEESEIAKLLQQFIVIQ